MRFYRAELRLSRKPSDLCGRDHPSAPGLDRLTLAEAEPGQQALLALTCLRKGETFAHFGAGFGSVGPRLGRYVEERPSRC